MTQCKCGSYAVNLRSHGRDGTDTDSCDVCFWRNKAATLEAENARLRGLLTKALDEFNGLPRSLGYDFTHVSEIAAALTSQQGEAG